MAKSQPTPEPKQDNNSEPAAEIMPAASDFTNDQLAAIESFEDAVLLARNEYGDILAAHEQNTLGTGFRVATDDDKMRLCGVSLLFLEWSFRESDYGTSPYVSVRAIQQGDNGQAVKWVLNDGSTGIAQQLKDFTTKTGRTGGLGVRRGLRVSEYPTNAIKNHPEYGKPLSKSEAREFIKNDLPVGKGRTFYIDTSA